MPKVQRPTPPGDHRTRVDRFMDRVKNNPVAAVVIVLAIAVGALASLTDSVRKLTDLAASFGSAPMAGEWKSEAAVFSPYGEEFMRLTLKEPASGQVVGDVQFSGNAHLQPRSFPVLEGKRDGKVLTLVLDASERWRETMTGDLAGDHLRLVLQRQGQGAVATVAQRVPQRPQLVAGRLAIVYKGQEYPDHRTACTRMLQDRDPPQAYSLSEPPDPYGNVHCAGRLPDGSDGFNQFQNDVQQQLVCPAQSRPTLVDGKAPAPPQGCECDGNLVATRATCGKG